MVDVSKVTDIAKRRKPKLPDWKANLILSERDRSPKGCLLNAADALRFAPAWEGVLGFDTFSQQVMCMAPPPWAAHRPVTTPPTR